jgi:hypothetical protein
MKLKFLFFLFLFVVSTFGVFAQEFSSLKDIKFEKPEEYAIQHDNVLACAKFLFDTPIDQKAEQRADAKDFLLRWSIGTPNYTYMLGDPFTMLVEAKEELGILQLAAMIQLSIENEELAKNDTELGYKAALKVVKYAENPKNNVKANKALRKMFAAKKDGTLRKYLKL